MIYSTLRIKREKTHSTVQKAPDELSSVHLHNLFSNLRHLLCASVPNYLRPSEKTVPSTAVHKLRPAWNAQLVLAAFRGTAPPSPFRHASMALCAMAHYFCCVIHVEPGILPTFLFINNFFHLIFLNGMNISKLQSYRKENSSIPKLSEQVRQDGYSPLAVGKCWHSKC